MDEHNVAKAVVLPLVSPESSSYLNLTEQALDAAKRFPDRLIPFCCIDPRTSYTGGRAGLRAMLKEYVDQGAKGFGEHKAGLPIDHPKMMALYEVCDDLKLPVLFHMDNLRGTDVPGLPGLERVLKAFPKRQLHRPRAGVLGVDLGRRDCRRTSEATPRARSSPAGPSIGCSMLTPTSGATSRPARARTRCPATARSASVPDPPRRPAPLRHRLPKPGQDVPQFELLASLELPARSRARIERERLASAGAAFELTRRP